MSDARQPRQDPPVPAERSTVLPTSAPPTPNPENSGQGASAFPQAFQVPFLTPSEGVIDLCNELHPPNLYAGDGTEDILLDFTGFMDNIGFSEDWQSVGLGVRNEYNFANPPYFSSH